MFFKKKSKNEILAISNGQLISIDKINDPTFSAKLLGDGYGLVSNDGIVVAPFDGEVAMVFPTKHALGLVNNDGIEMLIHIGIDTVTLNGEGFETLVEAGTKVKAGTPLVKFDVAFLKEKSIDPTIAVIISNANGKTINIVNDQAVEAGKTVTITY